GALDRPRTPTFLEQPEAHDVLQQPEGPGDAALVGEVRLQRFLIDNGLADLDSDKGPGPRADERRIVALERNGGDGGGRVVGRRGNHASRSEPEIRSRGA